MNGEELVNAARVDFGKTWPAETEAAFRRLGARLTEPSDDLPLERPVRCEHGVLISADCEECWLACCVEDDVDAAPGGRDLPNR